MAIECVTTAYGPPAHAALAAAVAQAKQGDPLAPVTVVVPNHYVGLAARRALGRREHGSQRGVAAVAFYTPYGLAERLGGAEVATEGRRGVSNAVIAAAVRAALRRDPGHFGGVETHPATERALTRAHRELSELGERQLDALAAQSRRAADVVRIHREVAAALESDYSNEQQLARAAAAAVRSRSAEARRRLGPVVVFLPQSLTGSQAQLLRAVSEATSTTTVAAATGVGPADDAVRVSLRRLGVDLDHSVPAYVGKPAALRDRVRALSVSDADDEVRHAVRAVVDAARAGSPLGRCAILYGVENPYARLIGDALDAAGIERCGATVQTVGTSVVGRSLLEMLALRDRGFSRRSVMAWLAGAPVSVKRSDGVDEHAGRSSGTDPDGLPRPGAHSGPGGHSDGGEDAPSPPPGTSRWHSAPTAAWERTARAARVDAGIESWRQRLARYAADCLADAERLQADEDLMWRAERLRRDAARASDLLAFAEALHHDLDPRPSPRTWADLASWCGKLVHKYLGGRHRRSWPDEERELAERVDAAISRLGDLDATDDSPSVAAFRRALQLELETTPHRHGRLGAGVLVGPVSLALGVELDLAVVCGMAEGVFPARRNDDALLPDRERRVVGHDLPARGDRSGDDHRAFLATVAAAEHSLLLYPRGDLRRAADRSPSRWLTEQADQLEVVPSFVGGLRATGFPAHEHEYDTRCLLDWHDGRGRGDDKALGDLIAVSSVRRRIELRRGIELRSARLGGRLPRFAATLAAGALREAALPQPTGGDQVTSASRLEAWASCPHAYFVRHVLRVEPIDDSDDDHRISALERGSLVHRILERWLAEAIAGGDVPAPAEPWPERWRRRLSEIGREECDLLVARGLVGRRLYWSYDQRQILADLARFVDFDDAQRAGHRSRPEAAELGFGMPHSGGGPVTIDLGEDRSLRIRGSIDRIDVTETGGLLVVDYKTGSTRSFEKLDVDDPTLGGQRFQLVLYDLAARRLRGAGDSADGFGAYWFVSSKGRFTEVGYPTNEVRRTVLEEVGSVVDGIGAGLFPLLPEEPGWKPFVGCAYCEPDGMGTKDQWRDWQRKHRDPALARFVDSDETGPAQTREQAPPAGAQPAAART